MKDPYRARQRFGRALTIFLLSGLAVTLYFAYRWAGSPALARPLNSSDPRAANIRLNGTSFTAYSSGHPIWSLRAGIIDIDRMPEVSLSSAQHASITDIRDGKLFDPPKVKPPSNRILKAVRAALTPVSQMSPAAPAATFHAQSGVYALNDLEPLPPEITLTYSVQWQFRLKGDVDFRTRSGDHLTAEELTILEMNNRQKAKLERRILCDSGAQIAFKDVKIQANKLRYNPADRTVECLEGARGTFKDGSLQTERLFWSLKDRVIHCPDVTTGTSRGNPFTASGLVIDLEHRILRANRFTSQIHTDKGEDFSILPERR